MGMMNILKALKVTSLQYLYNISKKMLVIKSTFCMQFLQVGIIVLYGSGQTCPKYQKRKLVIFLQYLKKEVCNSFCALLWCKTFWYFILSRVVFVPTCLILKLVVVASIVCQGNLVHFFAYALLDFKCIQKAYPQIPHILPHPPNIHIAPFHTKK